MKVNRQQTAQFAELLAAIQQERRRIDASNRDGAFHRAVQRERRFRGVFLKQIARKARRGCVGAWLASLDRAVGRSKTRKQAAAELLSVLPDLPEATQRLNDWLVDADRDWREWMVGFVGESELHEFAPALNACLLAPQDDLHLAVTALGAAGKLKSDVNVPALLHLAAADPGVHPRALLWDLINHSHARFKPVFARFFASKDDKEIRVLAAWGLGKLGDAGAAAYLAEMLDDPDERTPTSFTPGESRRAAQALCDIFGWPFEWEPAAVDRTRRRWQRRPQ